MADEQPCPGCGETHGQTQLDKTKALAITAMEECDFASVFVMSACKEGTEWKLECVAMGDAPISLLVYQAVGLRTLADQLEQAAEKRMAERRGAAS